MNLIGGRRQLRVQTLFNLALKMKEKIVTDIHKIFTFANTLLLVRQRHRHPTGNVVSKTSESCHCGKTRFLGTGGAGGLEVLAGFQCVLGNSVTVRDLMLCIQSIRLCCFAYHSKLNLLK